MSNPVGPVCHIPPTNQRANPQPKNIPGLPGPVQVTPGNIPGTLDQFAAMLNAMRMMLLQLAGQTPQKPTDNGGTTNNVVPKKSDEKSRWAEESRTTEQVKVYNPDDKSQYITVERINKLTMKDAVTGQTWTWDRNRK